MDRLQLVVMDLHIDAGQHSLEDSDGLLKALVEADSRLHDFAGDAWRPWFRAPAGYIAPWMAPVIVKAGFELNSSVNPSWLVRKKRSHGKIGLRLKRR